MNDRIRVAVLDDYQQVARTMADWSPVEERAELTIFHDHLHDHDALVRRLAPFDVLCVMRERTALTADLIAALPRLRLIASTGLANASIDLKAAAEHGVEVVNTDYSSTPTIEFTWSAILGLARDIAGEAASVRSGGWQMGLGTELGGKTLGILGLGRIGSKVARIGQAFGMQVIAWSENLQEETASALGVRRVSKQALLSQSDFLTIHTRLSERTRGIIGAPELATMKPGARLINSSRGPIVDEAALVDALISGRIAGAAVDVYETEPLPADHPFRDLPNVLATPHIGYVTEEMYRTFYGDSVRNIVEWLGRRT
ncbi:MAG: D-2-hydroxyacid dehydrogenase family protein [Luteibacter sp.]|uniref:D-2-hydroxyacid dehydrogenase family protein n=1 Tax=Luteibacter sp. TaxID=1886636 RepID=UPI002809D230|nr:D-2-hydroxyacid dehydrogenase family protein [Luteibacter sp.]MDQ7994482.1 D-2-hydroxyacid dehydrogenase family protein [Luteibacter sp.]MDQ8050625.1 D-2-hydroxyacid dehydrogenase family protein [Luteibacter sp.]